MKVHSLGHVVIKVRDLARSEAFYHGLLGLPVCARSDEGDMTFFSLGNHHDFAIYAVGEQASQPGADAVGLAHVAFNIGTSLDELHEARERLAGHGIAVRAVDHEVSQSLYFDDPDGNTIELYVDGSDVWRQEPARVAQSRPLVL